MISRIVTVSFIVLAILYVVACIVLDLIPNYGPPNFRYTGSDPSQNVWNFGWPLVSMIYDPHHGIQFGPLTAILVVLQVIGALMICTSGIVIRFLFRQKKQEAQQDVASNL